MKRNLILLLMLFCFILPSFVCATDIDLEKIKAEIHMKPEDTHPNGINMEVGTASFWLEVDASVSGDSGESVSYQWYESKTGDTSDMVPIENETRAIFIPEQKIGTTYYCVGVITKLGGKSFTEYTKLLEATFTPKIIDKVWITDVKEPHVGDEPSMSANQYTDYELNNYYGYEITSVKWTPDDDIFKEGIEYRVDIDIEFWDNVELATEIDSKINGMKAEFIKKDIQGGATVSYTFEAIESKTKEDDVEKQSEIESGEKDLNRETLDENVENEKLDISAIVFCTVCVIVFIFSFMIGIKRK